MKRVLQSSPHLKVQIANVLELARKISQSRPLDNEQVSKVLEDLPGQRERFRATKALHKDDLAVGVYKEDPQ